VGMKISVLSRSKKSGDEELRLKEVELPDIAQGDASHLGDIAAKNSVAASACIYCGAVDELTNEHIIPYAWGGKLQIICGSCAVCQKETQLFEGFSLNDGAMAGVRKIRGIQSRTKHKNAPGSVTITFVKNDGREVVEEVALDSAPLILGFPWFSLPGILEGTDRSAVQLAGWLAAAVGPDVNEFLRAHDATLMRVNEDQKQPVAFARTIAKIAYCYAWLDGVFEYVKGSEELVHAFMHEPSRLGAFVGMKPEPFERFPGMDFRLSYKPDHPGVLYMEVQPFPDIPAPTYLVVLGACENLRAWRKIRSKISGAGTSAMPLSRQII